MRKKFTTSDTLEVKKSGFYDFYCNCGWSGDKAEIVPILEYHEGDWRKVCRCPYCSQEIN